MPTKNPRINITFDPELVSVLVSVAKQEQVSLSSLAKELILEALERREDVTLSAIAQARDVNTTKMVSHDKAWKS
jgi:hypothetical protein